MAARGKSNGESGRLDIDSWTKEALAMLAEEGIAGIRVELLARRLNVTKGSFYWHFKDRDALLNAMLERWRRTATLALIDRLDSGLDNPRDRLATLLALPIRGRNSSQAADVELSIRLWGRSDDRARIALAEVDELRMRYISQLLTRSGVPEKDARARSILAYSYLRVAATLISHDDEALMNQCEAILLGEAVK